LGRSFATKLPFFTSKDGFPIGTYNSHEEAIESLAWKGRAKLLMNVTQIKDAIRYMSRSDKTEIYRWLDGELAGDLPYRIGTHRSITSRQESNGCGTRTATVSSPILEGNF
jgi:hypothetical protein